MRIIFPKVILNLNEVVSIVSSAVIALGYTLFGGLISVAYTDVIQIFFIVFGLFLALPFALTNEHVKNIYEETLDDGVTPAWYGKVGKGQTLIQSQIRPAPSHKILINYRWSLRMWDYGWTTGSFWCLEESLGSATTRGFSPARPPTGPCSSPMAALLLPSS